MAQRQFRSDDSDQWAEGFGSGSDGDLTIAADATDATANTTLTGTTGGTAATAGSGTGFAAGYYVLIHQTQGTGHGNWELNVISSIGAGTNWTMLHTLCNSYVSGAQVFLIKQYDHVTINSTKTLTGQSWNGTKGGILVLMAKTSITVTGNIYLKGVGGSLGGGGNSTVSGATGGGFRGGDLVPGQSKQGESGVGTGSASTSANGSGGGGAAGTNGSNSGGGGNAGHAGSGANGRTAGTGTGGTGGGTSGNAGLTSMELGSGGGGGQGASNSDNNGGRSGSSGGGIVVLISPTITVTGSISVNGGSDAGEAFYEGGAGSGGSILFKGQTITLGTTLCTASGGTSFGLNAGAGRIHADYKTSISGTTTPTLDSRSDSSLDTVVPGSFFLF